MFCLVPLHWRAQFPLSVLCLSLLVGLSGSPCEEISLWKLRNWEATFLMSDEATGQLISLGVVYPRVIALFCWTTVPSALLFCWCQNASTQWSLALSSRHLPAVLWLPFVIPLRLLFTPVARNSFESLIGGGGQVPSASPGHSSDLHGLWQGKSRSWDEKADAIHSVRSDSCLLKEYLVKLNRYRTTWCPMNGTGGSLPRSSRILTFPTSAPASPLPLVVITGKGPAVKMVRHPCLGLLGEAGHLEEPQIPGLLFVALIGINRCRWRGVLGSRERELPLSWLLHSLPLCVWCFGCVVLCIDRNQPPKVLSCLKSPEQ